MTEARLRCDAGERNLRLKRFNLILTLGFIGLCGLGPVGLSLSPRENDPIAVLRLRPGAVLPAIVADSDVRILWMSARGHLLILSAAPPGFVQSLYREGATLVVAANAVSGCSPDAAAAPSPTGMHRL